jgi:hypothetical protein
MISAACVRATVLKGGRQLRACLRHLGVREASVATVSRRDTCAAWSPQRQLGMRDGWVARRRVTTAALHGAMRRRRYKGLKIHKIHGFQGFQRHDWCCLHLCHRAKGGRQLRVRQRHPGMREASVATGVAPTHPCYAEPRDVVGDAVMSVATRHA